MDLGPWQHGCSEPSEQDGAHVVQQQVQRRGARRSVGLDAAQHVVPPLREAHKLDQGALQAPQQAAGDELQALEAHDEVQELELVRGSREEDHEEERRHDAEVQGAHRYDHEGDYGQVDRVLDLAPDGLVVGQVVVEENGPNLQEARAEVATPGALHLITGELITDCGLQVPLDLLLYVGPDRVDHPLGVLGDELRDVGVLREAALQEVPEVSEDLVADLVRGVQQDSLAPLAVERDSLQDLRRQGLCQADRLSSKAAIGGRRLA
mmetsp:Transcript_47399/g.146596  ORF Transcript_47399/g.146596 Transcript_47399/m.146596 type:complete len:265 (-) Transcript_47399:65-859(-)